MKRCTKCGQERPLSDFDTCLAKRDGKHSNCKFCRKAYREANKTKISAANHADYENHKSARRISHKKYATEHEAQVTAYQKEYSALNKDDLRVYKREYGKTHPELRQKETDRQRERRRTDIQFRLRYLLRKRLNNALNNNSKVGSAVALLGCTVEELKLYLERQFEEGMSWSNHSLKGWHIDHKKPLNSFDLTDFDQLMQACHYTNLQSLWWQDNLRKGDRT